MKEAADKARELVERCREWIYEPTGRNLDRRRAKQAAVIICEEMIKEAEYNNIGNALSPIRAFFWQEVKKQIQLL